LFNKKGEIKKAVEIDTLTINFKILLQIKIMSLFISQVLQTAKHDKIPIDPVKKHTPQNT
jgi:hypothetical protein